MRTIIQGDNKPIVLTFDESVVNIKEFSAILCNGTNILKSWDYNTVIIDNDTISLPLTQEETMEFTPKYIELEVKLVSNEDIELVATAKYTPIPRFYKGDIAFWRQQEVMIVEERDKDLCYVCYNQVKKILVVYSEKELLTEKEFEKTLEENPQKAEVEEEI